MRIGFDAKRVFHNFSGLGNYSRNTILFLTKYYPENKYFLYTPKPKEFFIDGVQVKGPTHWLYKKFTPYWRTFYLASQIEQDAIEVFHGLSNELPKNIHKKPLKSIVTIHDLIFIRFPQLYNSIDRVIYKRKFEYACHVADKIIAVSNQTKEDIIEFFNIEESKISVIYQGCNPVYFNATDENERQKIRIKYNLPSNYLLYVGTVEKRKNLLSIIKAVHLEDIDIPVVAVGRHTDYTVEVRAYIQKNSLKSIFLLGNVDLHELPALYQMADLFVYPSVFEGFGIPILEALTSKVPVITSKGSCFHEPGGDSTIYIDPYNVEELGDAIKKVLFNKELQDKMIRDGYEHALNFREELITDNLMREYRNIQ